MMLCSQRPTNTITATQKSKIYIKPWWWSRRLKFFKIKDIWSPLPRWSKQMLEWIWWEGPCFWGIRGAKAISLYSIREWVQTKTSCALQKVTCGWTCRRIDMVKRLKVFFFFTQSSFNWKVTKKIFECFFKIKISKKLKTETIYFEIKNKKI
jgi:hypothetical protein